MKYLAILRDSFREAIDSKVLYVMIGLSALVVAFIATMSFTPQPAERTLAKITDGSINFLLSLYKPENLDTEPGKKPTVRRLVSLELQKAEVVRGEPDSPDSAYRLTVAMSFGTAADADHARRDLDGTCARIREHFSGVVDLDLLRLGDIRLIPATGEAKIGDERKLFFQITTEPTSRTRRIWFTELSLFFGSVPLGSDELVAPLGIQLHILASFILNLGSWVAILTGIIITSFFIPNMLRKGSVDLLVSKPIRRPVLLLYKYVGGLTFILLSNTFAIVGIWLVLGLRSGVWANWFLLLILVLTFYFAILYSISTLFGVMTRSIVATILITCGAWFFFFLVGTGYQLFENGQRQEERNKVPPEKQKWTDNSFGNVVRAVHAVTPRTSDIKYLGEVLSMSAFLTDNPAETGRLTSTKMDWTESLLVSGAFIVVMLTLACWWFATKDY